MKKLSILLILLISFIPGIVYAENLTPHVDVNEKIYDYADLLTEDEENTLFNKVEQFINENNLDLVLVTIDKNPYGVSDDYTRIYAQDFYDYNDFGIGATHDGLIILIDMDNRYPYIVTTGNAIITYDDARINTLHDSAYDYLADKEYYEAFNQYVTTASSLAKEGKPTSNQNYCIGDDGLPYQCIFPPKKVNWGMSLLSGLAIALISLLVHLRKYKGIRLATNATPYLGNVTKDPDVDKFITSHVSQVRIPHDNNNHHSSGGGGSSISFGSSGRAHGGGGGRHF